MVVLVRVQRVLCDVRDREDVEKTSVSDLGPGWPLQYTVLWFRQRGATLFPDSL